MANRTTPQKNILESLKNFKTVGLREGDQLVCYYRIIGDDLDSLEKSALLLLHQARAAVDMLETADVTAQIMAPALAEAANHFENLISKVL